MRIFIFFAGGSMLAIEAMDDELDMRMGMWVMAVMLIVYAVQDVIEFLKKRDEKNSERQRIEAAKKRDQED